MLGKEDFIRGLDDNMVKLEFLGALSYVGCSGVVVDTGKEKLVLDYGTKLQEIPPKFPFRSNI